MDGWVGQRPKKVCVPVIDRQFRAFDEIPFLPEKKFSDRGEWVCRLRLASPPPPPPDGLVRLSLRVTAHKSWARTVGGLQGVMRVSLRPFV